MALPPASILGPCGWLSTCVVPSRGIRDIGLSRMAEASRVWAMPNKHTFLVKPLLSVVLRHKTAGSVWIDPFAGWYSPAEVTNDLNPAAPTQFHLEAYEFLCQQDGSFDGAIFDPPYSLTQVARSYQDIGLKFHGKENPTGGFPKVRDELMRLIHVGGVVVSFGWNSVGMGIRRGFAPVSYTLCCHGGNRNDTIVTVERRV